jgi:hypothetical protein
VSGPGVQELEATREALTDRYSRALSATAMRLTNLRATVRSAEEERDRLLMESAPVLRRGEAATAAGVSLSRVEQILGGEAGR